MKATIHPISYKGYIEPHEMNTYKIPRFAFGFLTEGEVLVEIEGKNILLRPGQLLLVPENNLMVVKYYNACQGALGSFPLDFLKDASYPVLRATEPVIQSFWFDDAVFIGALLRRMITAFEDKDKAFLQSGFDLLLSQVHPGGKVAAVPEKFLQLVFQRDVTPLTVSEYADMLQVTPNYLNKTVKAHTHRTAIDWIEIARLNLAKQLLKDPAIPIADIAGRTGLPDQSYFSRFFKKKTGLTPSQFRSGH